MPGKVEVEDLLRIIDLCRVVGVKGVDPFQVDVKESLRTLKQHLPGWKMLDDLLLDSDAVSSLSSIVRLQGEWLKHRASSLYIDPVLVELKIRLSKVEDLAHVLAESLHPVAQISQLFPQGLKEAMDYWKGLLPLSERDIELGAPTGPASSPLSLQDLVNLRVLGEEEFEDRLEELLGEAKKRASVEGRIEYWDFISANSFAETVLRAYLTSFMVSGGLLVMEVDPLEEKTWLIPLGEEVKGRFRQPRSVAISISYEDWRRRQ